MEHIFKITECWNILKSMFNHCLKSLMPKWEAQHVAKKYVVSANCLLRCSYGFLRHQVCKAFSYWACIHKNSFLVVQSLITEPFWYEACCQKLNFIACLAIANDNCTVCLKDRFCSYRVMSLHTRVKLLFQKLVYCLVSVGILHSIAFHYTIQLNA